LYLFLGQDCVINSEDVIGIFDLDNTSTSKITKEYLALAQKSGNIVEVTTDIPKSFVACCSKNGINVYLSQISPLTLKKRAKYIDNIANL